MVGEKTVAVGMIGQYIHDATLRDATLPGARRSLGWHGDGRGNGCGD